MSRRVPSESMSSERLAPAISASCADLVLNCTRLSLGSPRFTRSPVQGGARRIIRGINRSFIQCQHGVMRRLDFRRVQLAAKGEGRIGRGRPTQHPRSTQVCRREAVRSVVVIVVSQDHRIKDSQIHRFTHWNVNSIEQWQRQIFRSEPRRLAVIEYEVRSKYGPNK
jgi:hypothetical protein